MSLGTDAVFIDSVKARLRISEVVGKRVALKRRGPSVIGLCPFHNEKTPSFHVRDDKGYYHCFGCGAHGSVFDFLIKTENLTFPQALEKAANIAGVSIPEPDPRRTEVAEKRRARLSPVYEALQHSSSVYQLLLKENRTVLAYVGNRGIRNETLVAFSLGYAPATSKELLSSAAGKGIDISAFIKAGILVENKERGDTYPRFRERLVFPIHDDKGRVVGFGGRALKPDQQPKYLNSSDAEHFHKGSLLYGLYHIKNGWVEAQKQHFNNDNTDLLIVEGYMDVIALQQAGFSAVAPLGTALTEEQLLLAWRQNSTPVLCFDGDMAGRNAAKRAVSRALPLLRPGHTLKVILLPEGEDPDTLLSTGQEKAFKSMLNKAVPLVDFLWEELAKNVHISTPEQKAKFKAEVYREIEQIKDESVRDQYKREYSSRIYKFLHSDWHSSKQGTKHQTTLGGQRVRLSSVPKDMQALMLMATLLYHPSLIDQVEHEAINLPLPEVYKSFFSELLNIIFQEKELETKELITYLQNKGFDKLLEKLSNPEVFDLAPFAHPSASMEDVLKGWQDLWKIYAQVKGLDEEIATLADKLKVDPSLQTWERLRALTELRRAQQGQQGASNDIGANLGAK